MVRLCVVAVCKGRSVLLTVETVRLHGLPDCPLGQRMRFPYALARRKLPSAFAYILDIVSFLGTFRKFIVYWIGILWVRLVGIIGIIIGKTM